MHKEFISNVFDGYITKDNTVCFGGGEFACDVTQLYPGSQLTEDGYLLTKDGKELDLTDVDVKVEVGLKDIEISDDENAGGAVGNIISIIYKGDHYQLIVRVEGEEYEEDFVFDTVDTWNENDRVSINISRDKIKLALKQENKKR
jgi:spermidine/putrescine transport system ATP-binding protein